MVSNIFQTIGEAITNFAQVLGNGFTNLIQLFYITTPAEGQTAGLTPLGILMLIGAGVGIVYWAFTLVRSLISVRRAG